jgi:hypothetical protein
MCVCNLEVLDFVLEWITEYSEANAPIVPFLLYGHVLLNSYEFDSYPRTRRYVTSIL